MLTIWEKQESAAAESFCEIHRSESGESFNPNKVALYLSDESPYPGFRLARVEFDPQTVARGSALPVTIAGRSVTYALLRTSDNASLPGIIPIARDPHNITAINGLLGFRVTAENFLRYMTFFGHVVWDPPFYFFYRLDQLNNWISTLPTSDQQKVINSTLTVFSDVNGRLTIEPTIGQVPLMGKTFTFELPCFFQGRLYLCKCLVSENGQPEMLEDRPLRVEEIFDTEENRNYYGLDLNPKLSAALHENAHKTTKLHRAWVDIFKIDHVLQLAILPLFIFHLFVLFSLGRQSTAVFDYFDQLKQSAVLTYGSLVLGVSGTTIIICRYMFLLVVGFIRKRIPSIWSATADQFESTVQNVVKQRGYVFLFVSAFLEYSLKTLMNLSLLLYSISHFPLTGFPSMNFGQSVVIVLANIPFLKRIISSMFRGTSFSPLSFQPTQQTIVTAVVGFLFSTIVLGLITRLYLAAKKRT